MSWIDDLPAGKQAEIAREAEQFAAMRADLEEIVLMLVPYYEDLAHIGSGIPYDGILNELQQKLWEAVGWEPERARATGPKKKIPIPGAVRKAVLERDAYRCRYCEGWVNLHVHHVLPEVKGGPAELWNLVAACASCNLSIGTEFLPPAGWSAP